MALAHDVLNADSFENIADLADAVKTRAARLRIRYDGQAITDAIRTVARTREVAAPSHLVVRMTPPRPELPPVPTLTRHTAAAILAQLRRGRLA